MTVLRACAIAFSRFSAIPVPQFMWNDKDKSLSMMFFPLVGAVIGGLCQIIYFLAKKVAIPDTAAALIIAAVPMIVTGGIHLDGYMDVTDALCSYKEKNDKLDILKDPHIGAFAVINLVKILLIYIAAVLILITENIPHAFAVFCCSFVVSRSLSVIGLLSIKMAKKEGTLYSSSIEAASRKKFLYFFSALWIIISTVIMFFFMLLGCLFVMAAAAATFYGCRNKAYKNFGGITGDVAGYFVVVCEVNMLVALVASLFISVG